MANIKLPKVEPEVRYKIIEVDKALSSADWSKEDEESISTLRGQPGYLALLKKIKIRKSLIDSALQNQKFDSISEFSSIQAWSQCLRWLEGFIREQVEKKTTTSRSPYALEEEAFRDISKALEFVGLEKI